MRIDNYLFVKNYFDSRTKAKQSIERGEVFINGKKLDKPSFEINENLQYNIEIIHEDCFVSLGGYKLKKALQEFNFSVKNFVVADVGASTGGFTDCLLQNGAKKVYAVDLNNQLLHYTLKNNSKVVSIIKNAKDLTLLDFEDELDFIVADLSFISVTKIIPIFSQLIGKNKHIIILVKPQFESNIRVKHKNGIIRDDKERNQALENVLNCAKNNSFEFVKITKTNASFDKNIEFLLLLRKI